MEPGINPLISELEAKAKSHATSKAVVANDFVLSFAKLNQYVKQIAGRLRALGIAPGDVVVTKLPLALDWIVTLALTHEATVSHSALISRPVSSKLRPDWLICLAAEGDSVGEGKTIVIDNQWLANLGNETELIRPRLYPGPDSPLRLSTTSGTTGEPKVFPASVGALTSMIEIISKHLPTREHAVSLVGMPALNTFWGLASKLYRGEPQFLIHALDGNFWEIMLREKVELVGGSPKQLENFIKTFELSPELSTHIKEVRLFGATPSDRLLEKLIAELGLKTFITYGTTEVGMVSVREAVLGQDNRLLGKPVPGVEVRVKEIAESGEGKIQIKPPFKVADYRDNLEATRAHLDDGWFTPGDIVELTAEGEIRFVGRSDDVVNLGGEKYSLDKIDAIIAGLGGMRDAASFLVMASGENEIHIAAIADKPIDEEAVRFKLDELLPGVVISQFHFIAALPRTETGKIQRRKILDLLE